MVETVTDGVTRKHWKNYIVENIYGNEWNKSRWYYDTFKLTADSKNYTFHCKIFPNYDNNARVALQLINGSTEQLTVWLSITLNLETILTPLVIADKPVLFSKNGLFLYYEKPRPPSMPSFNSNYSRPSSGNKTAYMANVIVDMYVCERSNSVRVLPQPVSAAMLYDLSYKWKVVSVTRAVLLALRETGHNQLQSSVFPDIRANRASPLLFYATLSSKKLHQNDTSHTSRLVTTGLCYAFMCKPKAEGGGGGEIQIKVSISQKNRPHRWHNIAIRLGLDESVNASNPKWRCLSNTPTIYKFVYKHENFVQRLFKVQYDGDHFSCHSSSDRTNL